MPDTPSPSSPSRSIPWAVFLGSSWTWCIGMFLPVLLVRQMGLWGWVVFAVPNVIGAAAMGWVLKTADASRELVHRHRPACTAFSLVTIAFHLFFTQWMIGRLLGLTWVGLVPAMVVLLYILGWKRPGGDLWTAAGAWVFSAACFALVFLYGGRFPSLAEAPSNAPLDALYLLPVCIFGFTLCPYLDLTFHRARQNLDLHGSRLAFTLGFGIFFFAMIVFSLAYAAPLAGAIDRGTLAMVSGSLAMAVGLHMFVQTSFTVAIHAREVLGQYRPGNRLLAAAMAAAVMTPIATGIYVASKPVTLGMDSGEFVYRLFLGFYGLIFPSYVWLYVVPSRSGRMDATKTALLIVAAAHALPMFWMGFIRGQMWWLLPGVSFPLLIRPLSRLRHVIMSRS